jgi:hypothetical protein
VSDSRLQVEPVRVRHQHLGVQRAAAQADPADADPLELHLGLALLPAIAHDAQGYALPGLEVRQRGDEVRVIIDGAAIHTEDHVTSAQTALPRRSCRTPRRL